MATITTTLDIAKIYNDLPTLAKADERFTNRETMFRALAKLLSVYENEFGVCLIHAHCTLSPGEIMLSTGDVSHPIQYEKAGVYYPERWLPNGEPFEFTKELTRAPPSELFEAFQKLTKSNGVLGLYYANGNETPCLEQTFGRSNYKKPLNEVRPADSTIETGWNLGKGQPVTMACVITCDTRSTRAGGYHKDTKTHS